MKKYIGQFFYRGNGGAKPDVRKFWTTLSWATFFGLLFLKVFGPDIVADRITEYVLTIVAGKASLANGAYIWNKKKS